MQSFIKRKIATKILKKPTDLENMFGKFNFERQRLKNSKKKKKKLKKDVLILVFMLCVIYRLFRQT